MREFIEEIREEFLDFIEDFGDLLRKRPPRQDIKQKPAVIRGQMTFIRPAYLFAERVENSIKILFGASILLSAITSTIVGFASLSTLVEVLVKTWVGRLFMIVIGLSYLIVAVWKTLHLNKPSKQQPSN